MIRIGFRVNSNQITLNQLNVSTKNKTIIGLRLSVTIPIIGRKHLIFAINQ
jgi:hypothetical protein